MQRCINDKEANRLFPVFLKLETLSVLVVGGGNIGLEKLSALLANAPAARIRLVGIRISEKVKELAAAHSCVSLEERVFLPADVEAADVVIIAIDDPKESRRIRDIAKAKGKLVNVADKPELCDFYMGSIVQKGNLKIAISTNGKSPTIAKRLKEIFNELLPEEIDELLDNMQRIRSGISGDFAEKVKKLNALTREFSPDSNLEQDQAPQGI